MNGKFVENFYFEVTLFSCLKGENNGKIILNVIIEKIMK